MQIWESIQKSARLADWRFCIYFRLSRSPFPHVKNYAAFPTTPLCATGRSGWGHVKRPKTFEKFSTIEQASKSSWPRAFQGRCQVNDKISIEWAVICSSQICLNGHSNFSSKLHACCKKNLANVVRNLTKKILTLSETREGTYVLELRDNNSAKSLARLV